MKTEYKNSNQQGSVRKKGSAWYVRYRTRNADGSWREHEKKGGKTKREAEAKLRYIMAEYNDTGNVSDSKNMTVNDLADLWYQQEIEYSDSATNTKYCYRNILRHIREHKLGTIKLKNLTVKDLQDYIDEKAHGVFENGKQIKHKYSESHMHQQYVVLNMLFKFASNKQNHLLRTNIFQDVTKRKKKKSYDIFGKLITPEKPTVSKEDFNAVLSYLENHPTYYVFAPALLIGYNSGARSGEIVGITDLDCDFENRKIHLMRSMYFDVDTGCWELKRTKSNEPREIIIGNTLLKTLKDVINNRKKNQEKYGEFYQRQYYQSIDINGVTHWQIYTDFHPETKYLGSRVALGKPVSEADPTRPLIPIEFICSYEDGALMTTQSLKYLNKIIRKAFPEFDVFKMRSLRHTYSSNMIEAGATPKMVQEQLGHFDESLSMTVYIHSSEEAKINAVDEHDKKYN